LTYQQEKQKETKKKETKSITRNVVPFPLIDGAKDGGVCQYFTRLSRMW
jgi:hypothetical protein